MSAFDAIDDLWFGRQAKRDRNRFGDRTCEIIQKHGYILLKRADGWYLHQHTNLAAGFDSAVWGQRESALHFDSLEWAFIAADYLECKVVSFYPERVNR